MMSPASTSVERSTSPKRDRRHLASLVIQWAISPPTLASWHERVHGDFDDRLRLVERGDANGGPCREGLLGDELAMDLGHRVNVPSEVHVVGGHRDDILPARGRCIENLPNLLIRSTHLGEGSVRGGRGTSASRDEQQIADLDRGGKARLPEPLQVRAPSVRLDRPSLDHGSVYT